MSYRITCSDNELMICSNAVLRMDSMMFNFFCLLFRVYVVLWFVVLSGCTALEHSTQEPASIEAHSFRWLKQADGMLDLYDGDRRVLRYVHSYDPSTEETLHETYKCYYHVYDVTGKCQLTKGSGGLYTHHRGLFIGWNRLTIGNTEYDFWHMKETTQRHSKTTKLTADKRQAQLSTCINWCNAEDKVILIENRSITVYDSADPQLLLLDFESKLTPVAGDVLLNGDPEHAGFQFRAHNNVAEGESDVKATYLFHEDGIDPTQDHNLPWAAMSFGLNGKHFTVQHMNHPDNPRPTVYSAYRDYGRFGAFPILEIPNNETRTLRYRVYVMQGKMPQRSEMQMHYQTYIDTH